MTQYHDMALSMALAATEAAPFMAASDGGTRNAALARVSESLRTQADDLIFVNKVDVDSARDIGLAPSMLDRLTLDKDRIEAMADGVAQVAALPDPVGQILDGGIRPNGLHIHRVRTPLGVILMIYEARPNVTIDAASLCIKSGNACILRGGSEALATNLRLGEIVAEALSDSGLPARAVQVVDRPDRELIPSLLGLNRHIDLVVPRGGKGLVATVMEHSRIPILKHLDGICHTYVDAAADLQMAATVVVNAKTNRPSTCNATETLLVHENVAREFVPACFAQLSAAGVELRADPDIAGIAREANIAVISAQEDDWKTEYNALVLAVKMVPDLTSAISHINTYGSKHTDAIITQDIAAASRFTTEVDSSSVMVNASTRFADGFEYGLGAEIGISTDKIHARGPVGLHGLTTYKWVVEGSGQVRS